MSTRQGVFTASKEDECNRNFTIVDAPEITEVSSLPLVASNYTGDSDQLSPFLDALQEGTFEKSDAPDGLCRSWRFTLLAPAGADFELERARSAHQAPFET